MEAVEGLGFGGGVGKSDEVWIGEVVGEVEMGGGLGVVEGAVAGSGLIPRLLALLISLENAPTGHPTTA